ncbi:putative photosynthetic complex assembly protein PuhE [Sphingomonas sp. S1-29]|uniref:putative photosynthetic complex assembly protein PuhE n=1 Tax=Sphingomonas sp. S1-29 TaxID=2991074 RepID=UPI00223EF600|nr:putative photosynthetic complex assembly protein PuhE [Sphingomonas sp. S1-29]UZK69547.1 putative photosynthetic complex assembly protein PuhE [Sphingomonas sp. S1-29]
MTFPPLLFALLMWFVGTAAVVWLDSRPRATFRTSFRLAGVAALAATGAIWWVARDASASGAYIGFAAAIVIWGWHEMGFLMGFVAGPRRTPCPAGATGMARFRAATETVIHHEVALAATAIALFVLCWGQPNQAAPLTFALLFALRLSAKINLFLGVANLSDEIFPAHLAYLKTYFGTRPINAWYPVSLALGVAQVIWAWNFAQGSGGGAAITAMLLVGLGALGVVEHLFLVLPLRDGKMWVWASAAKPKNKAVRTATLD